MKWMLIAVFAWAMVARADELRNAGRVWELAKYLHGTTEEIRDQLNGELERQLDNKEDAENIVSGMRKRLAVTNVEAVEFTRSRPDYLKLVQDRDAITKEREALQSELAKARATGTSSSERLDLSARYNHARIAVDKLEWAVVKMEQDAPITYPECIKVRERLKGAEDSLARATEAAAQSAKWRDKLLDATRNSFILEGPLAIDSQGLVGAVTCEKIFGENSMLVSGLVQWGRGEAQQEKEGITTVAVHMKRVRLGIAGIDTSKMKEGKDVVIDQTIQIVKVHFEDGPSFGITYLAKHVDSDVEDLFKTITPLLPREARMKRKSFTAQPATKPQSPSKPVDELTRLRLENAELKSRIAATRPSR